ncbi:MAG: exodeoxyribonuclease V subunit gamma [Fibrobacter sp.]|nr:exodeoxyribonuclease V subunit gamma [Fibrobacter sp.]
MLHLNFALNLKNLADEMIDEISRCWKNPFEAPVVIFPDPKLEQWFRLRWVQKKGVVANLEITTIDKFLFRTLSHGNASKQKISADILRNVLIAYLKGDALLQDVKNLKEIQSYLASETGEMDDAKLFDFANTLAGLFLEYETSRPGDFISPLQSDHYEGLLAYWKQGELRDFFSTKDRPAPKEKWQRFIYAKLFHNDGNDSLLTRTFKATVARSGHKTEFLTLPYLFSLSKDDFDCKAPIFIFGLSGMGQFYRVILQQLASQKEVYAYIQNPCMEFWEDVDVKPVRRWNRANAPAGIALPQATNDDAEQNLDENENLLLKNWGRTGRENIRLWCLSSDYTFDFKDADFSPDSLLHQVQYLVAHRKNEFESENGVENADFAADRSLTLTAAPSALREIEALHTEVCHLLQDGIRLDEMIVVSPNLDQYRTPIEQVFNAAKKDSPFYISFTITDYPEKDTLIENAVENLFEIHQQGYISRPAFFSLVKNPVVQASLSINPDYITAWEQWIVNMNVFRHGGKIREDDWEHCVNQLLLSQVSASPFRFENDGYVPYSDIESGNTDSVQKFIDCIDGLRKWIAFAREGLDVSEKNSIQQLEKMLSYWVSIPANEDGFVNEKNIWYKIQNAIDLLNIQFDAGAEYISWKIVQQTIQCACKNTRGGNNRLFSGGLTFMKFSVNRTIPARHIFFIGANASVFPGRKKQNTMDLRTQAKRWPGDDSVIDRNCYTFLCQLMSAADGFHISYINRNLQKDEELFPASVVRDLQFFIASSKVPGAHAFDEKKIPLDETRKPDDLFTQRALRNRMSLYLDTVENQPKKIQEPEKSVLPDKVTTRELKQFFEDPFRFQLAKSVRLPSLEDNPEKELFEPIDLKAYDKSKLLREYVHSILSEDFSGYTKTEQEWILRRKFPNGIFGEIVQQKYNDMAADIAQKIQAGDFLIPATYQEKRETVLNNAGHLWTLMTTLDWYTQLDEHEHLLFTVKKNAGTVLDFIKMYLDALLIAASSNTKEIAETFHLRIYLSANDSPQEKSFEIEPETASSLLKQMFDRAYVKKYAKCAPVQLFSDKLIMTFADYRYKLTCQNGPWEYFDGKKLFAPEKFSGFSIDNFKEEWTTAIKEQTSLLAPIWSDENE